MAPDGPAGTALTARERDHCCRFVHTNTGISRIEVGRADGAAHIIDTEYEIGQDNLEGSVGPFGFDIHNPVFAISGLAIVAFVFYTLALPEQAGSLFSCCTSPSSCCLCSTRSTSRDSSTYLPRRSVPVLAAFLPSTTSQPTN